MKNRLKIWYIAGRSPDVHELTLSRSTLSFAAILGCLALAALLWIGNDYLHLKRLSLDNAALSSKISVHVEEIKSQRNQIQAFVSEINSLKSRLSMLSNLEEKVRIMADLELDESSQGLFGIGGIDSSTLDADMPLDRKHNSLMREMHQEINVTQLAAVQKQSDFEELLKLLEEKRNLLVSTPSIQPTQGGWISCGFGYRQSPFTGKREFHSGLDIAGRPGSEIYATADGRISYARKRRLLGNLVMIDHGHGIVTKYGHLKKILVKSGDLVKRGDIIGLMGNTGRSTGNHLHYEVVVNGTSVNPKNYILN